MCLLRKFKDCFVRLNLPSPESGRCTRLLSAHQPCLSEHVDPQTRTGRAGWSLEQELGLDSKKMLAATTFHWKKSGGDRVLLPDVELLILY